MAYILHIDTSGDIGTVAISKEGKLVDVITTSETRNHASTINLHIEQVLATAGINFKDLAAVSVCGGPGSYTGLRIGLATAKGLCYALDKPLMMHNRLTLMALSNIYDTQNSSDVYISVLEARANEYFIAAYNKEVKEVLAPQHVFADNLPDITNSKISSSLSGHIDDHIMQTYGSENDKPKVNNSIDIHAWIRYDFESYNCNGFVSLANSEPYYLKQVYTHKPKNIK